MNADESQQYDLGRQARTAGFSKTACNLPTLTVKRACWLAGWHDADMELLTSEEVKTDYEQ
jgi:ribosome modulation factor